MAAGGFVTFATGALFGAGIGTAIAVLFAPQEGATLRGRFDDRLKLARLAGIEAQSETESAMIHRYREKLGNPDALRDLEQRTAESRTDQIRRWTESAAGDNAIDADGDLERPTIG